PAGVLGLSARRAPPIQRSGPHSGGADPLPGRRHPDDLSDLRFAGRRAGAAGSDHLALAGGVRPSLARRPAPVERAARAIPPDSLTPGRAGLARSGRPRRRPGWLAVPGRVRGGTGRRTGRGSGRCVAPRAGYPVRAGYLASSRAVITRAAKTTSIT